MDPPNEADQGDKPPCARAHDPRRRFLIKSVAAASGGLAYAVPALTGIAAFLNPLGQKSRAGQLLRVASLDMLPEDGTPLTVSVVADRVDAWTSSREAIGGVLLRRVGPDRVEALNVVCPHAGCSVVYQDGKLFCPCHAASFDLDGKRLDATSPSPRDLDTLEVEIRAGTEIWVRFENFQTGVTQKVPEA